MIGREAACDSYLQKGRVEGSKDCFLRTYGTKARRALPNTGDYPKWIPEPVLHICVACHLPPPSSLRHDIVRSLLKESFGAWDGAAQAYWFNMTRYWTFRVLAKKTQCRCLHYSVLLYKFKTAREISKQTPI